MAHYTPQGYDTLHKGVKQIACDLKDAKGQQSLHALLATSDVLLTSFRPSALNKLGLGWKALHKQYPGLSLVSVVGAPGPLAEIPGHDLTYQAEVDLVPGMDLPASLFADMGGAMMASEAVLKATLVQRTSGKGSFHEVALSDAAAWLALPRHWGMTLPKGAVGGAHAGYRVYRCQDGRVAVAALETEKQAGQALLERETNARSQLESQHQQTAGTIVPLPLGTNSSGPRSPTMYGAPADTGPPDAAGHDPPSGRDIPDPRRLRRRRGSPWSTIRRTSPRRYVNISSKKA